MKGKYATAIFLLILAIIVVYLLRTYYQAGSTNITKNFPSKEELESIATRAVEDLLENISQGNMTSEELSDYLG